MEYIHNVYAGYIMFLVFLSGHIGPPGSKMPGPIFFSQSSPIKKQTSIAGINTTIKIKHLFKIQRFKTDNKNKIPICIH